jgi:hypothetical protein
MQKHSELQINEALLESEHIVTRWHRDMRMRLRCQGSISQNRGSDRGSGSNLKKFTT